MTRPPPPPPPPRDAGQTSPRQRALDDYQQYRRELFARIQGPEPVLEPLLGPVGRAIVAVALSVVGLASGPIAGILLLLGMRCVDVETPGSLILFFGAYVEVFAWSLLSRLWEGWVSDG